MVNVNWCRFHTAVLGFAALANVLLAFPAVVLGEADLTLWHVAAPAFPTSSFAAVLARPFSFIIIEVLSFVLRPLCAVERGSLPASKGFNP